jgi:putative hemolysin
MALIEKGRYVARLADDAADLRRAQALRARVFRPGRGAEADADAFDALCRHMLIEDRVTSELLSCFRILPLPAGAQIGQSYSAQFYDLSRLHAYASPMAEIGRFCIAPGVQDMDILRLAWGAVATVVDTSGARFLFGCSSFRGNDTAPYLDAFALLRDSHLAPDEWRPGIKASPVFSFSENPTETPDPMRALRAIPPLLRSYLAMGGWVSDHAVIDRDLGTLHVFTGLDVDTVPEGRKKLLRAVAQPG